MTRITHIWFAVTGIILASLLTPPQARAIDYTNESLNYEIVFQWGLIWKHAASATLSIKKSGDGYHAMLVGRTRSWADKIYPMRDTLKSTLNSSYKPVKYQKLTHENGYDAVDIVDFSYSGGKTHGKCVRYRPRKEPQCITLQATGEAYDMLSIFYFLRRLKFDSMRKNTFYSSTIFSGKEKEKLAIKYLGLKSIKLFDGSQHNAHHVSFTFTTDNGKQSSDAITAYLSTDEQHIPLLLIGKLPVGSVRVYYNR